MQSPKLRDNKGKEPFEFLMFEQEITLYDVNNYERRKSEFGTIYRYDLQTQKQKFTWQPSGLQFTIFCDILQSARKFAVKRLCWTLMK
jgi:hypothetical protein